MVDLSLRDTPSDSRPEVPAKVVPIRAEPSLPQAKGPVVVSVTARTAEQESKTVAIRRGIVPAWRELSRTSISRIPECCVEIFARARKRIIYAPLYAALALAIALFFVLRHRPDSVKSQSQISAPVEEQQRASIPPQKVPKHTQAVAVKRAKHRRQSSDYIAKDTYIYYGKNGKPNN